MVIIAAEKVCPKCQISKPLEEFGKNSSKADGLQSACKKCRSSQSKTWYEENAEVQKQRSTASKRKAGVQPKAVTPIPENILKFWHPTKNDGVDRNSLGLHSHEKVWWQCDKGHEWFRRASHQKTFCPVCLKAKPLISAVSKNSKLVSQWNVDKNGSKSLQDSGLGSSHKAWWKCDKGHEWRASIYSRSIGAGCPICAHIEQTNKLPAVPFSNLTLIKEWSPKNDKKPYEVSHKSGYAAEWICSKCNHIWIARVGDRVTKEYGCPKCAKKISRMEQEIQAWAENLDVAVELNSHKVIGPQELDIYFPDHKIAVEVNGVYWHSDLYRKDPKYHYSKWKACKDLGIQLIQVWEDDWNSSKVFIFRMLEFKLGLSKKVSVFARKTVIFEFDKVTARSFLEENHIQGFASGSGYLGLKDKQGVPVAILVVKKAAGSEGKVLDIVRYATSTSVPGGFTKLLKEAVKVYNPERFVTFSDHMVSDGGLYENNGFVADKELDPDYMYVVNGVRHHKFGFRLKRFRDDPNLQYVDGLSERELALLNNIPRVWDAGKTRWVLNL